MNFSFAKVWAADKDSLEEIEEDDRVDSWTLALEKIQAEQIKEAIKVEAESGRGRRKAAAAAKVSARQSSVMMPDTNVQHISRKRWVPMMYQTD